VGSSSSYHIEQTTSTFLSSSVQQSSPIRKSLVPAAKRQTKKRFILTAISNTEVSCTRFKEREKDRILTSISNKQVPCTSLRERDRERERASSLQQSPIRKSLVPAPKRERERERDLESYVNYPCIQSLPFLLCEKDTEREREREREREWGKTTSTHKEVSERHKEREERQLVRYNERFLKKKEKKTDNKHTRGFEREERQLEHARSF
jgi:hypothetical protein